MQATITRSGTENANPAGAVNANGVVGKSSITSKDSAFAAQLQAQLEQLTVQAGQYVRAQEHPSKLTAAELATEEMESLLLERTLGDALATLDSRRRALVSERSFRLNMLASAHRERALELLS